MAVVEISAWPLLVWRCKGCGWEKNINTTDPTDTSEEAAVHQATCGNDVRVSPTADRLAFRVNGNVRR
jgi:hypothetical protein